MTGCFDAGLHLILVIVVQTLNNYLSYTMNETVYALSKFYAQHALKLLLERALGRCLAVETCL